MHDYGHYALLVGRIPVFLLAFICTERKCFSCIQTPKTKLANSFHCHSFVVCSCAIFKTFKNIIACFVKLLAHGSSSSCFAVQYPCWHGDAINLSFHVENHVSCYAFSTCLK